MGRRRGVRVVAAAMVLLGSGCILKTDLVGSAFNGGALDSTGDPFRKPDDLMASRVERVVEQEVSDGYFRQGKGGCEVASWLDQAGQHPDVFADLVKQLETPTQSLGLQSQQTKDDVEKKVTAWMKKREPICKAGPGGASTVDPDALHVFLDERRFKEAFWRAANRIAPMAIEGLVDDKSIQRGAQVAFERASKYVGNRKWTRREKNKTTALAIEGGAASGIFAAGAVWVVLHLVDSWMDACKGGDKTCADDHDVGFRLISGTSTGAMIAVAVDRFNSMKTHEGRAAEINNIAKWFTCYSFSDLMCIQSTGVPNLLGGGKSASTIRGVLEFDGIQKVLTSCVKPWMFDNVSELILNTTEFRSGRIFALSDQNELTQPEHVVHASLASALLPIIGDPDRQVWSTVPFDPKFDENNRDATEPAYLDGGIRSELPILPLVRRGAERVLAVASGGSMVTEVKRMTNAIDIAARYINVNTGSVMETELEYSKRVAESERQCEIDSCMNVLEPSNGTEKEFCPGAPGSTFCSRWNVCHGDLANACTYVADKQDYAELRREHDRQTLAQRLDPFWKMEALFVDQSSVDGLSGYDFRPSELRRLFRAGAEAARVRCLDIARLLGIMPKATAAQVNAWCAVRMDDQTATCAPMQPSQSSDFKMRACDTPVDLAKLPDYLDSCKDDKGPR